MIDWNYILGQIATVAFDILYFGAIIGTIVIIILDNRNPVKTMAWILILLFLPIVCLVFYFFFGRSQRRERIIGRKSYDRLLKKPMAEYLAQDCSEVQYEYSRLIRLFQHTNQAFPFEGNRVAVYTEGYTKLQSLLRELQKAKQHIHMEYYIFEDDAIGRMVRDVLIEKASHGVEVRVIYDDVGCWNVKDGFFKEMKEAGIEVYAFLRVAFPVFTSKVNYRNHRKIIVIDGKVGFMGGMNIADRYDKGTSWGTWRDTHFKFVGKGVHGLQSVFLIDWYVVSKKLLNDRIYYPAAEIYSDNIMQIATSGPVGQWRTLLQATIFMIANAKKYIFIQTPYFLPTEGLNQALQTSALGGVDVRLMLPKRSDTRSANMASHSFIDEMVKAGVKVYLYKPGFLHSKLVVSDDALTSIGSANMDFRSFEHNFEINAFVYQKEFALQMKRIFTHDMHHCERLIPSRWLKRPLKQRMAESFMRLFSPLL
mgnify:CR=1 FL=1